MTQPPNNLENLPTIRTDGEATVAFPFHDGPTGTVATVAGVNLRRQNYSVGVPIGVGGMGAVLQADDKNIERTVAMKVLLDQHHASPAKLRRFLQEARILGQLEHPNIVSIHDLGVDEQGRLYYTMNLVRGRHLRSILERIHDGDQETIARYPLPELLTVFVKLCDAVAYAHSRGILHRDLKPENVMVGDYGEVVLMDWGLAKQAKTVESHRPGDSDVLANSPLLTVDGMVLGTPHFLSPEQAEGRVQDIDERTDVFALGGILYNILTLHTPYPGATAEEVVKKARFGVVLTPFAYQRNGHHHPETLKHPLPHCPGGRIPESLAAIAMKALARDPSKRYSTAQALADDVRAYQAGFATSLEAKSTRRLFALMLRRRRKEFLLAGAAMAIILAVGAVALTRIVQSEKQSRLLLDKLRQSAPAFAADAQRLMEQTRLEDALGRIDSALSLDPQNAEFHLLRGHILQTLLRMSEAGTAYSTALALNPGLASARDNLSLCQQFIEDNRGRSNWLPSSLNNLHASLLRQQRSAEALAIMRQFGADKGVLYDTWRAILTQAGYRLNNRSLHLDVRGQFTLILQDPRLDNLAELKGMPLEKLVLQGTKVSDFAPLQGAMLTELELTGGKVADLSPLACMPLRTLILRDTPVGDLSPLASVPLQTLVVDTAPAKDLTPLRESSLKVLHLRGTLVEDLEPLVNLSLEELNLENTPITDLSPLTSLPLKRLSLAGCREVKDWNPLGEMRHLEVLVVPEGVERHPALKKLAKLKVVQTKAIGRGPWPAPPR